MNSSSNNSPISDNLDLRQKYDQKTPKYQRLINLVSLILDSAITKNKIKIHSMKYRVKDYKSFLEKIERKNYKDPFRECTDLAGVRIICLFTSQVEQLKKIIQKEFEIVEISDKKTTKKFDQFGYLSLHMIVKVPQNRLEFIESEGLEDCVCEIQIRTILQEAWAEIEHYINYKTTKEEKNQALLRKIFSLAGMFEVADSTFEDINSGFTEMIERKTIETGEITALTLYKFSKERFPWFKEDFNKKNERSFLKLTKEISTLNIRHIEMLRKIMDIHKNSTEEILAKSDNSKHSPINNIRTTLALEFGDKFDLIYGIKGYSDKIKKAINKKKYSKY